MSLSALGLGKTKPGTALGGRSRSQLKPNTLPSNYATSRQHQPKPQQQQKFEMQAEPSPAAAAASPSDRVRSMISQVHLSMSRSDVSSIPDYDIFNHTEGEAKSKEPDKVAVANTNKSLGNVEDLFAGIDSSHFDELAEAQEKEGGDIIPGADLEMMRDYSKKYSKQQTSASEATTQLVSNNAKVVSMFTSDVKNIYYNAMISRTASKAESRARSKAPSKAPSKAASKATSKKSAKSKMHQNVECMDELIDEALAVAKTPEEVAQYLLAQDDAESGGNKKELYAAIMAKQKKLQAASAAKKEKSATPASLQPITSFEAFDIMSTASSITHNTGLTTKKGDGGCSVVTEQVSVHHTTNATTNAGGNIGDDDYDPPIMDYPSPGMSPANEDLGYPEKDTGDEYELPTYLKLPGDNEDATPAPSQKESYAEDSIEQDLSAYNVIDAISKGVDTMHKKKEQGNSEAEDDNKSNGSGIGHALKVNDALSVNGSASIMSSKSKKVSRVRSMSPMLFKKKKGMMESFDENNQDDDQELDSSWKEKKGLAKSGLPPPSPSVVTPNHRTIRARKARDLSKLRSVRSMSPSLFNGKKLDSYNKAAEKNPSIANADLISVGEKSKVSKDDETNPVSDASTAASSTTTPASAGSRIEVIPRSNTNESSKDVADVTSRATSPIIMANRIRSKIKPIVLSRNDSHASAKDDPETPLTSNKKDTLDFAKKDTETETTGNFGASSVEKNADGEAPKVSVAKVSKLSKLRKKRSFRVEAMPTEKVVEKDTRECIASSIEKNGEGDDSKPSLKEPSTLSKLTKKKASNKFALPPRIPTREAHPEHSTKPKQQSQVQQIVTSSDDDDGSVECSVMSVNSDDKKISNMLQLTPNGDITVTNMEETSSMAIRGGNGQNKFDSKKVGQGSTDAATRSSTTDDESIEISIFNDEIEEKKTPITERKNLTVLETPRIANCRSNLGMSPGSTDAVMRSPAPPTTPASTAEGDCEQTKKKKKKKSSMALAKEKYQKKALVIPPKEPKKKKETDVDINKKGVAAVPSLDDDGDDSTIFSAASKKEKLKKIKDYRDKTKTGPKKELPQKTLDEWHVAKEKMKESINDEKEKNEKKPKPQKKASLSNTSNVDKAEVKSKRKEILNLLKKDKKKKNNHNNRSSDASKMDSSKNASFERGNDEGKLRPSTTFMSALSIKTEPKSRVSLKGGSRKREKKKSAKIRQLSSLLEDDQQQGTNEQGEQPTDLGGAPIETNESSVGEGAPVKQINFDPNSVDDGDVSLPPELKEGKKIRIWEEKKFTGEGGSKEGTDSRNSGATRSRNIFMCGGDDGMDVTIGTTLDGRTAPFDSDITSAEKTRAGDAVGDNAVRDRRRDRGLGRPPSGSRSRTFICGIDPGHLKDDVKDEIKDSMRDAKFGMKKSLINLIGACDITGNGGVDFLMGNMSHTNDQLFGRKPVRSSPPRGKPDPQAETMQSVPQDEVENGKQTSSTSKKEEQQQKPSLSPEAKKKLYLQKLKEVSLQHL